MRCVRAAEDFETIRFRLEELRRECARIYVEGPVRGSAVPHTPRPRLLSRLCQIDGYPLALRRQRRMQFWNRPLPARENGIAR